MINPWALIHSLLVSACMMPSTFSAQPGQAVVLAEDRRLISVTVTVLDPNGDPVSGVVTQVLSRNGGNEGPTGPAGTVTLTLEASPTHDDHILVRLCEGYWAVSLPDAQKDLFNENFEALRNAYAFPDWRSYPITANGSSFSVQFDVLEAVNLSGTLRDAITGDPITFAPCGLSRQNSAGFTGEANGDFQLKAIRGSPAWLVFNLPSTNEIRLVDIPSQSLDVDLNLGDVVVAGPQSDASAEILLASALPDLLDPETFNRLDGKITLIDSEAERIYSFYVSSDRTKFVNVPWDPDMPNPRFAAGSYYLAPGAFSLESATALRRALLDGKHTLLQSAGVPVLTVGSGGQATINFDVAAANAAILSVANQPSP